MQKEAKKELTNLSLKLNDAFELLKFMKKVGKDIEGGKMHER